MDKSKMPKVSVIIPTYNRANYIVDAIESIRKQTYQDIEIIIIDDGSTDNTKEIIEGLIKHDQRIIYKYQNNKGVAAARNSGIDLAKGEYIAFLDSDDISLPNRLKEQVYILEKHKDIDLVYGKILVKDINKNTLELFGIVFPEVISCKEMFGRILKYHLFFSICTVTMRKKVTLNIKFNTRMIIGEDLLYFLQASRNYIFYGVDKPFTILTRGHNSLMQSGIKDKFDVKKCLDIILHDKHSDINMNRLLYIKSASNMYLYFAKVNFGNNHFKYLKYLIKAYLYHPFNIYIYKHLIGNILHHNKKKLT